MGFNSGFKGLMKIVNEMGCSIVCSLLLLSTTYCAPVTICSSAVIPVSVISTLGEMRLSNFAIIPSDGNDCVLHVIYLICVTRNSVRKNVM